MTQTQFAKGYQAALADISQALNTGGLPAVKRWLDDNRTLASMNPDKRSATKE